MKLKTPRMAAARLTLRRPALESGCCRKPKPKPQRRQRSLSSIESACTVATSLPSSMSDASVCRSCAWFRFQVEKLRQLFAENDYDSGAQLPNKRTTRLR